MMNKFYYPMILTDNMDKLSLAMSNEVLFIVLLILLFGFILYLTVRIYLMSKSGKKRFFTKDIFYATSIWVGILFSVGFIWFTAIPAICYFEIFVLTIYNKENYNKMKINRFTIISILFFSFISILLNFVLGIFW